MPSQLLATALNGSPDAGLTDRLSYNPQQASLATGLPLRTITAAIASGDLRSFKVGRRRLIFRDDLERYLRGEKGFAQK
jgi:excisionase family DNA binding protein